jgi:6-phosphogluconolactonase (cycloisomerase 2 family)
LQSFLIGAQGLLDGPIDTVPSGGDAPAFTAPLNNGQIAIMNVCTACLRLTSCPCSQHYLLQYNTGNGKIIPFTSDPLHFSTDAPLITFPSTTQSHPHMALQHESEVFVPDLGADKIWRLIEDGSPGNWKIQGFIQQPTGSGPRHIATRGKPLS